MRAAWADALEASVLAEALRGSIWAYPLVNAGHILGVALLVGGSIPLTLRLSGLWKTLPLRPLRKLLSRTAGIGFLLAVCFGFLLFSVRASRYLESGIFLAKMGVLTTAFAGSVALLAMTSERRQAVGSGGDMTTASVRVTAGTLLVLWPSVLVLGRLIGYF